MSRRSKKKGKCHICGFVGPLSYEHVPPEAAFNNGKYYYTAKMEEVLKFGDSSFETLTLKDGKLAKKKQGGIGFYTLCAKCNNDTGSWYGTSFIDWIYQGMAIVLKANKNPSLYYPTYIYPLRIIKQIIAMFFSVEHPTFGEAHPYLIRFVLNKEQKYLPETYRIFTYYNIEGSNRYIGSTVLGSFVESKLIKLAEISFPPMGFVLTIDSDSPDSRLTEISYFARYGYNDWIDHHQRFATLPTHLPFYPGDYRTSNEIQESMREGHKYKYGG